MKAYREEFEIVPVEVVEETALFGVVDDADAVVIPWSPKVLLSSSVLAQARKLELIVATYGGIKRNVDAHEAVRRGIRLTCTGPARARSVAEFTLGLTMSSLLHIARIHHEMRGGESFPRHGYTRELTGRTIGIIGFGAVTQDLMNLLQPFDAEILVTSGHASETAIAAAGGRKIELTELLSKSEIVIVMTGLTVQTEGMIGAAELAQIRDGGLIVNTARGKIIRETDLIAQLRTGRIAAALDVYETEPLRTDSPLRDMDNVVITAHSANSTREMDLGRWSFALSELRAYFAGQPLAGEIKSDHLARMSDD